VHWIHADYTLSELDAYELFSKVGKLHLTEMVDPNYVVIAAIEKQYLPQKSKIERCYTLPDVQRRCSRPFSKSA
jgi:acetamidase/formamidase